MRLILALFFPLLFGAGYLAFDYWNVNRMAKHGDGDGVTVSEYLGGWVSLAGAIGAADEDGPALPGELAGMMPKAPEGWTVRPTEPGDVDAFLPAGADEKAVKLVRAVVSEREGNGLRQVRQTYQNGARTVVVELVRYPDFIFTSFGAMALKMELQMTSATFSGRDFMTVRGMEIHEDVLPEGIALRYLVGDVADQIWVRVLAPRTMTDEDLLPFFETLHVPAMNANVVEKVPGMGEVPVIVLASVIDASTRAALEAEREAEFAQLEAERAAKEAEAKAAEDETKMSEAEEGGSMFGGLAGALFGSDDKEMSKDERQGHQEALIDAAKSGNGAAAALHAGALYGAIADELGKTEMKPASPSSKSAGLPGMGAGFKSSIEVGIGACGDRAGGKVCSVAGAEGN